MSRHLLATLLGLSVLSPTAALAGARATDRFYHDKRQTTSPEAFLRAERNLAAVAPGMSEKEFLAAMELKVLARGGRPVDVALDGYLPAASRAASEKTSPGRAMVLGYVADGDEVPRITVILVDHKVAELIRH